jgi:hypothetical protein
MREQLSHHIASFQLQKAFQSRLESAKAKKVWKKKLVSREPCVKWQQQFWSECSLQEDWDHDMSTLPTVKLQGQPSVWTLDDFGQIFANENTTSTEYQLPWNWCSWQSFASLLTNIQLDTTWFQGTCFWFRASVCHIVACRLRSLLER